jgi:hypothetical protein
VSREISRLGSEKRYRIRASAPALALSISAPRALEDRFMKIRRSPLLFAFTLPMLAAACGAQSDVAPAAGAPPPPPPVTSKVTEAPPAAPAAAGTSSPEPWIARSNENAKLLLECTTRSEPEGAARLGVDGHDDEIIDLREGHEARLRACITAALTELEKRGATETDALVKQDIAILEEAGAQSIKASTVLENREVPFAHVGEIVFEGLRSLLNDQISPARRPAAVARLRRYTGLEAGTKPLADLAREETTAALATARMAPSKLEVEKVLQIGNVVLEGAEELLRKFPVAGSEEPLRALKQQLGAHQEWIKAVVLPRARKDFRLHPEVYAVRLEGYGVDRTPEQLIKLGHTGFDAIKAEMQKVAAVVARERRLPRSDYVDVIRTLKKEQVVGDAILPLYTQRLADIEAIIRKEHLITLPQRAARIRLATPAESAQSPAPYLNPPRLLGNTGEQAEFVLPLSVPPAAGSKDKEVRLDDFTYAAASWTLTAHEARPGHELQFSTMVERGVSTARAIFAFNSANVEGWGLYAEAITEPYMPPEGQLISLQLRLGRAARAFLDPELELGKTTPAAARALLEREVGYSSAFANSEVERYTFRSPGQATSYFYGYTRLVELRHELEAKLGARFDLGRFDDWVVSQGLLPPELLRAAALKEFAG